VVCSPTLAARLPACTHSATLTFNGNDAVLLACDGAVVDAIGTLGQDPGASGWGSGDARTTDMTLQRDCAVTAGDPDPSDPFEPDLQWIAVGADATKGLGSHCVPGGA
jgi:hypothetical protein